ncbi:hypothetical protein MIZ03_3588 [Rhodoferax lithotrophicus]|uniref:Glycosyltransferase RgtA/B/C/D-like domain-containing protein n=1 Tax=Rhodoferax lithotrophicus TaxID=2798804 RepID=A0ABM7MQT7_9BURK|nr:hypothetical protein [Rhodoferax sp. MIZ03]BCO28678.1 hypothetical protein MIZ03_3588 [Rhodoferax sp. MIZ03]
MSTAAVTQLTPTRGKTSTLLWLSLLLVATLTYVLGLDGQYAPTNGDELVYTHIARLTAASGHWLPLVSELDHMRNTKPPLLIWQAMVAGDWGQHWSMAALRTPSVVYTLLLAAAIGFTVQRIRRDVGRGLLAACLYLAFFCTFRFGRTYLTSAPETFWLNLPMFVLLWWTLRGPNTKPNAATHPVTVSDSQATLGWLAHALFGLAMGLGLAYKSFALAAPAAATLWCAQLLTQSPLNWRKTFQITLKVSLSALIALSIFSLWFVLDPDPAAVWQEFVVGENAGKMSNSAGYWHTALLGGGFSIWAQLLGYAQNAGLLIFVVFGLMALGVRQLWRRHWQALTSQPINFLLLLIWLAVWLAVFTLPSQRSARYLIPAMPALAMVLALCWEHIGRIWFVPSLLLCGVFIGFLGRIAWAEQVFGLGQTGDVALTLIAVAIGLGLVLAGLFKPAWTRACTLAACLAVFAVFGLTTVPLNGSSGHYSAQVLAQLQAQKVAVPSSFNGQFERFEFVLPGNHFVPYDGDGRAPFSRADNAVFLNALLEKHQAVVWLQTRDENAEPLCTPQCTVLGQRWEVKGRHQSGEITLVNVWYPEQWLFRREWLLTNAASVPSVAVKAPTP